MWRRTPVSAMAKETEIALGLIETKGLIGAVEAADAMCKAAKVTLLKKEKVGGGLGRGLHRADLAAHHHGHEAAADLLLLQEGHFRRLAHRVGELVSVHVIPRPAGGLEDYLPGE